MGLLSFLKSATGTDGKQTGEVSESKELFSRGTEYAVRRLCFDQCVNLIASSLGRCEVRTYLAGSEVKDTEYWLWNVEPNGNMSSTAFWKKLTRKLFENNEVLIVPVSGRAGKGGVAVADSFSREVTRPAKPAEYTGVQIDGVQLEKTLREGDVIYLRLNNANAKQAADAMALAYSSLITLADRKFKQDRGRKVKVHVGQIAQGTDNFTEKFADMIQKQVKPFFESTDAVLPEFDGYDFSDFYAKSGTNSESKEIRALIDDVLCFTARSMLIPMPLVDGSNQDTKDAYKRFLTHVIDPIAEQLEEEINRKRYGYDRWHAGDFVKVDTSSITHFDMFDAAANVEKLIGSGLYSINDVLRAASQTPIDEPWANAHYMTLNISGVEDATRKLEE